MATFRFPTTFSGNNTFISNKGGGITLHNTRLQASGTLLFEKNEAVFGGAIAMDDRCIVSYGVACKTGIIVRHYFQGGLAQGYIIRIYSQLTLGFSIYMPIIS